MSKKRIQVILTDEAWAMVEAVTKEDVERVAHRMFGRPFSASAVGRNIDGLKLL